jgi:hypothetical protein
MPGRMCTAAAALARLTEEPADDAPEAWDPADGPARSAQSPKSMLTFGPYAVLTLRGSPSARR